MKNAKFRLKIKNGEKEQMIYLFNKGFKSPQVLEFLIDKETVNLEIFVFFVLRNKDFLELKTATKHIAQKTSAFTYVRGVVYDEARAKYAGMIRIEPTGQMTNAYLQSNILLVGKGAKADNIPSLEIEANEVKASHGATVGRIDEELLFYIRSRGLPRQEAEKIFIEGFFEPIIAKIAFLKEQSLVRKWLFRKRYE